MSRRDNGLPGDEWQLLTDLAPPLADHVLEILRDEGIAAYAAPAAATGGAQLEAPAHDRPLDEVFVGGGELERARDLLEHVLPRLRAELDDEPAPAARDPRSDLAATISTDDDVWAGIIAAYSAPAADPVARWSATEDVDTATDSGTSTTGTAAATAPVVDDTAPTTPRRSATGFDDIEDEVAEAKAARTTPPAPADDPHDHYIPPPPPPIPQGDPITRTAWVALLGGPLWLILATLFGWGPGGLPGLVAVLAFVGGFITLITRMGDREDDDDDGAVV